MTNWVARFYGLEGESQRVKRLAQIATLYMPLSGLAFGMSSTFFAVFVATILIPSGPLEAGMALVGILASISALTQLLFDYPTGGIGDWIGQRWIIASSFIFLSVSLFLLSIAKNIPHFWFFVIIYVLLAIGGALYSGAFTSWFDTNYRAVAKDPERKVYSVAQGRIGMLFSIINTAVLIPGALFAVFFGRQSVFFFQAVFCAFLGVASLRLFRDYPEVTRRRPQRSMASYFTLLKDGLKFSYSRRLIVFFLIGSVLIASTITVWGNMLLFTMYYNYLYDDVAVATFRTALFALETIWIERAGVWTKNLSPSKWIPRFTLLQMCGPLFYFLFATITFLLPPQLTPIPFPFMYIQIPALLICGTFILTAVFTAFSNLLTQRLLLDLIPDRIRNSFYSLIPTLTLAFALPQVLFFAPILSSMGVSPVIGGLGIISTLGLLLLTLGMRHVSAPPPTEKIKNRNQKNFLS